MFGKGQVSDKDLLKQINQRLARTGTASQSKVNVSVQQGNVTLSGTLQHAIQRSPIVKAVSRVTGVRRVMDQMQHTAKKATRPDAHQYVHLPEPAVVVESPAVTAVDDQPVSPPADEPADRSSRPE
jgi:phosphoribosylformylglycinamidine (FGAM) synthase-like enzyme